jgi:NADH dehydrogenase
VPTFNRKARVVADWTLASLFQRDVVALGSLARPRQEFNQAATPLDANDPARLSVSGSARPSLR